MALIVENGTGIENADSYVSILEIDQYAEAFGNTAWLALGTPAKEINARKATRFLDNNYPWPGTPKFPIQSLFFPATGVEVRGSAVYGVPRQIKNAACELALISQTKDLTSTATSKSLIEKRIKAGDFEKTEKYSSATSDNAFAAVEMIIAPLLSGKIGKGLTLVKIGRA